MASTRKPRIPMAEQIRLISECRQSGMTDAISPLYISCIGERYILVQRG